MLQRTAAPLANNRVRVNTSKKSVIPLITDRISKKTITKKRKYYFPKIEIPLKILVTLSIITLLGAAYAVTTKSEKKNQLKKRLSNSLTSLNNTSPTDIIKFSEVLKNVTTPSIAVLPKPSSINHLISEMSMTKTIAPKTIPPLSRLEKERIRYLQEQLLIAKQKALKIDLSNHALKNKLETLVTQNRDLSHQLHQIDSTMESLKKI